MSRVLISLLTLTAAPSLLSDDLAVRKRAASAWAAKHGEVKLLDGGLDDAGCLTLRAPASARCDKTVQACLGEMGMGSCSGYGSTETYVVFARDDEGGGGLMLEHVSGDEFPEGECSGTVGFAPTLTAKERREGERQLAKEYARCVAAAAKRQKAEQVVRHCKVLTVDPCREEAFVRCTGRNEHEQAPPRGKTLRFSWAATDAGTPEGGEWEQEVEGE